MLSNEDKKLIGGSDIATVLGMSRYRSPIDLWQRIVEDRKDEEVTESQEYGTLLEPIIRTIYQRRTGARLLGPQSIVGKPQPYRRHNLDDVAVHASSKRVVEFKSADARMAHQFGEGKDEIPEEYLCQVQDYLGVTGLEVADVAVFIGGRNFKIYEVKADKEFYQLINEACEQFWKDYVLTHKPPPVDASESYSKYLAEKFRVGNNKIIEATPDAEMWAGQYLRAKQAIDIATSSKREAQNHLEEFCGPAKTLKGDGWRFTWADMKGGIDVDWESVWHEIKNRLSADQQMAILARHSKEKSSWRRPMVTFSIKEAA